MNKNCGNHCWMTMASALLAVSCATPVANFEPPAVTPTERTEASAERVGATGAVVSRANAAVSQDGAATVSLINNRAAGRATARAAAHEPRTAGVGSTAGGDNGATAHEVSDRSDDRIVAARLRNAAEQEPDPQLRAKLWKEYANFAGQMNAR
jgi:hypothetical protein